MSGSRESAPGLLVLPGWDDDSPQQFHALQSFLAPRGWVCRRADLPDAAWPRDQRERATREDSLTQTLHDWDALLRTTGTGSGAALGFSYGGYMAALLAGRRTLDWIVLRSPALYPDEGWDTPKAELDRQELDAYRRQKHAAVSNLALASCASFRGDVLLVESEFDETVPTMVMDNYVDAFSGARTLTRHVLRGADHELSRAAWREEYHELVCDWLVRRTHRAT